MTTVAAAREAGICTSYAKTPPMPMGCAVCGHPPYAHGCTLCPADHDYAVPTPEQYARRMDAWHAAGPHRLPGRNAPAHVAPAEVIPLTRRQRPAPPPAVAAAPAAPPPTIAAPAATPVAAALMPAPAAWPPPAAAAARRPVCTRRTPRWRWRHGGLAARPCRAA